MAQVHRFLDLIAVSLGTGKTAYLTPDEAESIAAAMIETAETVRRFKFTESPLSTRRFELGPDHLESWRQFEFKRGGV